MKPALIHRLPTRPSSFSRPSAPRTPALYNKRPFRKTIRHSPPNTRPKRDGVDRPTSDRPPTNTKIRGHL